MNIFKLSKKELEVYLKENIDTKKPSELLEELIECGLESGEVMEEDIKILLDFIKYIRFNEEKHYTIDKYYTAIENSVEHMRDLTNKNEEQEKIIELAIDELYLFNAYDCDYSDLKEHTCIKNDDDTVEIQKAKCKKCIREIIEKKAKGE